MNLNQMLTEKGIDPTKVLVLRHAPHEAEFRKVFPMLAADRPDLFNAFQQTQTEKLEKAMLGAEYLASFIAHDGGKAVFIGLYKIGASKTLTLKQYWQVPAYIEMKKLGVVGFTGKNRSSVLWFDLKLMDFYGSWKGKLIVDWPPPERSWWRRAHRNEITVSAILEDSALDPPTVKWDEIDFSWAQLAVLTKRWQAKLAEWRGVYYIFDELDAKGYVGSAYSDSNLLGRWRNYASTSHGGNKLLRHRDPTSFRFTILELVSPNMPKDDVIRLEGSWKKRLHTRAPFGLNDN